MRSSPLVYYITAHGYGHGARSCDILRAFHETSPDVPITVVTDLPASFLRNRLPGIPLTIRPGGLDVGMTQLDSVRVDVDATRRALEAWVILRPERIETERSFLRSVGAHLVVSDIPSIPFEAAADLNIPSVGVGNFTWNWIYSAFAEQDARWRPAVQAYEEGYRRADLLLRLPFAEPMTAFPVRRDIAMVARPGRPRRDDLAALTGAPLDRRWILLSFSTLDWDDAALARVEATEGYVFFTVRPLEWRRRNIYAVDREQMSFSDVLASVDAVVTKPGFGVLSECVVNQKPMAYVERTDFLEYPILEAALQRYLQHQHLPARALYQGDLKDSLDRLWTAPPARESLAAGGDQQAAAVLRHLIGSTNRQ